MSRSAASRAFRSRLATVSFSSPACNRSSRASFSSLASVSMLQAGNHGKDQRWDEQGQRKDVGVSKRAGVVTATAMGTQTDRGGSAWVFTGACHVAIDLSRNSEHSRMGKAPPFKDQSTPTVFCLTSSGDPRQTKKHRTSPSQHPFRYVDKKRDGRQKCKESTPSWHVLMR